MRVLKIPELYCARCGYQLDVQWNDFRVKAVPGEWRCTVEHGSHPKCVESNVVLPNVKVLDFASVVEL